MARPLLLPARLYVRLPHRNNRLFRARRRVQGPGMRGRRRLRRLEAQPPRVDQHAPQRRRPRRHENPRPVRHHQTNLGRLRRAHRKGRRHWRRAPRHLHHRPGPGREADHRQRFARWQERRRDLEAGRGVAVRRQARRSVPRRLEKGRKDNVRRPAQVQGVLPGRQLKKEEKKTWDGALCSMCGFFLYVCPTETGKDGSSRPVALFFIIQTIKPTLSNSDCFFSLFQPYDMKNLER